MSIVHNFVLGLFAVDDKITQEVTIMDASYQDVQDIVNKVKHQNDIVDILFKNLENIPDFELAKYKAKYSTVKGLLSNANRHLDSNVTALAYHVANQALNTLTYLREKLTKYESATTPHSKAKTLLQTLHAYDDHLIAICKDLSLAREKIGNIYTLGVLTSKSIAFSDDLKLLDHLFSVDQFDEVIEAGRKAIERGYQLLLEFRAHPVTNKLVGNSIQDLKLEADGIMLMLVHLNKRLDYSVDKIDSSPIADLVDLHINQIHARLKTINKPNKKLLNDLWQHITVINALLDSLDYQMNKVEDETKYIPSERHIIF